MTRQLDQQARMRRLDAWLDELDAEFGAPSGEAMAEAREWLAGRDRAGEARITGD